MIEITPRVFSESKYLLGPKLGRLGKENPKDIFNKPECLRRIVVLSEGLRDPDATATIVLIRVKEVQKENEGPQRLPLDF